MATRLITPPAGEPISLDEAKLHLRVDTTDDDALITALIGASRSYAEQWMARALVLQTWELVIDAFPLNEIMLPLPPLQQVVSIKYDDANGVETTLDPTEYDIDNVSQPGWVVPAVGGWPRPGATFQGINAVRIQYTAGYLPDSNSPPNYGANVPQPIRAAMLLYIGQLYENREDVIVGTVGQKMPVGGWEHLLRPYRVALGMA